MRKTQNINLNLYDQSDTFNITGSQNSLNSNFEIIDEEINAINNTNSIDEVKNDVASLKWDLVNQGGHLWTPAMNIHCELTSC